MTITPTPERPILIAYDGSDGSRAAIAATAEMFPGASAVVIYARQPLEAVAAHLEGHPALEEVRRINEASVDTSDRIAAEGATHANDLAWPPKLGCPRPTRPHRSRSSRPPKRSTPS